MHTSDYVSDRRPVFTLFQLQFGAMSPNGTIKPECVSSIICVTLCITSWHKTKGITIPDALYWPFLSRTQTCSGPLLSSNLWLSNSICQDCIPITSACKQVAGWNALYAWWSIKHLFGSSCGVIAEIKKRAKQQCKSETQRLKRQQIYLCCESRQTGETVVMRGLLWYWRLIA